MSENEKVTIGKKTFILSIIGAAAAASVLSFGMFALAGKLSGTDKADNTQEQLSNQGQVQGQNQAAAQIPSQDSAQGQALNQSQGQASAQTPNQSQNPSQSQTSPTPNAGDAVNPAASDSYIGEEAAKAAALADAGVQESDISYISCIIDYDDGRAEHYDVEFMIGSTEYEYEIDLYSGSVLAKSIEKDSDNRAVTNQVHSGNSGNAANLEIPESSGTPANQTASDSYIGEESAWSIVLTHAGLKDSEISQKQIKLDLEDGIKVYEIEFHKGWTEYEYEINAVSGEIIKAEKD
ncbi:MAG: PepSY domain-containing protein [Bacteroidales bacterium]|nr:PepSY domain-containing protein [Lachnoclostridium sp.]MCM1385609.1 PepSY domain-containing protein [Lachnoclostridium sp.]MCM1466320.1 PepSY domain-containing protein [Bacteroidales bacterium]